ncbi:MAG: ATP-binding protein [Elusimicrobiota bacterium]
MMIERIVYDKIEKSFKKYNAVIILGPRQVGKTTLVKEYIKNSKLKAKYVTGDDIRTEEIFSSKNLDVIKDFVSGYELLAIDEAQKIKNIGENIKLAVDNIDGIKFILTGSSSFELLGEIGEPLVGRKKTIYLFPFSTKELNQKMNNFEIKEKLSDFLIFGFYPRVFLSEKKEDKIETINEITNSYLLKDILKFEGIKKSSFMVKILRLLAFQVGSEVSFNEIANNCDLDVKTVQRYLDLLEKNFIIYELKSFSKNPRKEISKKKKYYFYDNGVLNSLISNFNSLDLRDDAGRLWENFIFMERIKRNSYNEEYLNCYFWKSINGKEIDLIEEKDAKLSAYEFKYSAEKIKRIKDWEDNYKSDVRIINKYNFLDFIL